MGEHSEETEGTEDGATESGPPETASAPRESPDTGAGQAAGDGDVPETDGPVPIDKGPD